MRAKREEGGEGHNRAVLRNSQSSGPHSGHFFGRPNDVIRRRPKSTNHGAMARKDPIHYEEGGQVDAAVFVPLEPNRPGDKSAKKQKIVCCIYVGAFPHPATDSGIAKIRLRLAAVPFWDGLIEMPRLKYCLCFLLFQIEERLRQLKSENNEIDHGSGDDVAAAKAAAADGSGNNNGLLGHWGEQKRWRRLGPKKQRKLKYGEGGSTRVGQQLKPQGETQNLFNESNDNHEMLKKKAKCSFF